MDITYKEAKKLDVIMGRFTQSCWRTEIEDEKMYTILSGMGYVSLNCTTDNGYDVMLTEKGDEFRARSSFKAELKNNILNQKNQRWSIINAKTATIISIISLLLSIVTLLLQFVKKTCP